MNYEDNPKGTREEIARIQNYLRARGVHVTDATIVDAAINITKRLGAGNYTFYTELS